MAVRSFGCLVVAHMGAHMGAHSGDAHMDPHRIQTTTKMFFCTTGTIVRGLPVQASEVEFHYEDLPLQREREWCDLLGHIERPGSEFFYYIYPQEMANKHFPPPFLKRTASFPQEAVAAAPVPANLLATTQEKCTTGAVIWVKRPGDLWWPCISFESHDDVKLWGLDLPANVMSELDEKSSTHEVGESSHKVYHGTHACCVTCSLFTFPSFLSLCLA